MITNDPEIIEPRSDELLPCPFCGSEAGLEHDSSGSLPSWRVYCRDNLDGDCPIGMTNTIGYARRVEAADAWNKRVTIDEIVAKRIAKYTADIGRHTAPSQPDGTCRCGACMQVRSIIGELEYIQMAARNLAPRTALTAGKHDD